MNVPSSSLLPTSSVTRTSQRRTSASAFGSTRDVASFNSAGSTSGHLSAARMERTVRAPHASAAAMTTDHTDVEKPRRGGASDTSPPFPERWLRQFDRGYHD